LTGVALMMEAFKVANAQKHQKAGTLTDNRWRLGRHSRRKSMLKVATLMLEVATLFVLTLTLGTIIWYTIETWRLRRTAQQQIRIALDQQRMSVQPVVILEFDRKLHKQQHGMPKVCNIGIGPAFNSKIRSIGSSQAEIRFEPIALLKPSAELDIEASVYRNGRYHQRLRDGKAFVDQLETLSTAQVDLAGGRTGEPCRCI